MTAILHIGGHSSICNLRTGHAVVRGDHLWDMGQYQNIIKRRTQQSIVPIMVWEDEASNYKQKLSTVFKVVSSLHDNAHPHGCTIESWPHNGCQRNNHPRQHCFYNASRTSIWELGHEQHPLQAFLVFRYYFTDVLHQCIVPARRTLLSTLRIPHQQ